MLIKASISGELGKIDVEKRKRYVPPQLTSQKLAEFFGEANTCWIIDDIHKIKKAVGQLTDSLSKLYIILLIPTILFNVLFQCHCHRWCLCCWSLNV